jgi:hypothetical protein
MFYLIDTASPPLNCFFSVIAQCICKVVKTIDKGLGLWDRFEINLKRSSLAAAKQWADILLLFMYAVHYFSHLLLLYCRLYAYHGKRWDNQVTLVFTVEIFQLFSCNNCLFSNSFDLKTSPYSKLPIPYYRESWFYRNVSGVFLILTMH